MLSEGEPRRVVERIREQARLGDVRLTLHADDERVEDGLADDGGAGSTRPDRQGARLELMQVVLSIAMIVACTGGATDEAKVRAAEERVFAAIMARDAIALRRELASDFILSSPGKPDQALDAFIQAIASMPYRILEVSGEDLHYRLVGDVAILSGVQRAKVEIAPGHVVVARTAFADVFAREGDRWLLRHAFSVELPEPTPE